MRTDMFQQALEDLNGSTADIEASALISTDGLMIASALPHGMDEDRMGAMSAALLSLGERTARDLIGLLERVVTPDGTGKRASVPGYRVAGKTGTAWKATGGGYSTHRYNAVFGGVVPATRPKLAALVETIRAEGENPTDYVEITFGVSERAYGAWPESIRRAFTPARTLKTGKQTFRLLRD